VRTNPADVLIAGGGIGGLSLALALRRCGSNAVVWERAAELREIGAGLLLTPNAVWVLQQLDLLKATGDFGRVVEQWQILDRRGNVLQTFAQKGGGLPSISITRSAFQQLLFSKLPSDAVLLDREVVSVSPSGIGERIAVRSARGETADADLIVGADGGRSMVRDFIAGAQAPRTLGYVGWRGLVSQLPSGWENGRITESWGRGGRFGIAPVSAGRTYWYATENVPSGWDVPPEKRKAHLLARFRDWHSPICELIEATNDPDILLSSISEQAALRSWFRGSVTLLGDAAHLMTPNLGQGAAMALEDAWILAECLRAEICDRDALKRYERLRKRRASLVVWLSHQVGRMIQLENPALAALRDGMLRVTPDWVGACMLAPVFNFRA